MPARPEGSAPDAAGREDRLAGVLLGTALGDALGLPAEGLSSAAVRRRFGRVDRFRLIGRTGFVSDDTEQAALVAQSLARGGTDDAACVRHFRRALLGWLLRLPFGIGRSTLEACLRLAVGRARSGVRSAGNGAAMRAAVLGVALSDPGRRRALGRRLAEVTHTDPRAVEGALYVAEVAALADDPPAGVAAGRAVVGHPELAGALADAVALAADPTADVETAAARLGNTGYVVHTLALATFAFLRADLDHPAEALAETIAAGGDTDTIAAIVGAWLGAARGAAGLPDALIGRLHDGPFGPTHLRALARALAGGGRPPRYSALAALLRNLALYPVVLAHGLRRLLPL